jgi:hypothetical protein
LALVQKELFTLRRDAVIGGTLRIDETIVEGASSTVKTEAPAASVYIYTAFEPKLAIGFDNAPRSREWLFPSPEDRAWDSKIILSPLQFVPG